MSRFKPPGQMSAGMSCDMNVTFKPMVSRYIINIPVLYVKLIFSIADKRRPGRWSEIFGPDWPILYSPEMFYEEMRCKNNPGRELLTINFFVCYWLLFNIFTIVIPRRGLCGFRFASCRGNHPTIRSADQQRSSRNSIRVFQGSGQTCDHVHDWNVSGTTSKRI